MGFIRCWRSVTIPGNCWRSSRAAGTPGRHGSGSYRDHRRRDRGDPGEMAAQPTHHRRRRRVQPRGGRPPHHVERTAGLLGGLLGRVRPGRAGPHRDRRHTGAGVGGRARRRRRRARGRAGRRGDRAAAAQHRRRPAQHLAGRDADHGAARADRDRRPVVTVRADQRLPVSGDRHRHRRRAGPAARGAPPRARPRRGIHPLRQGHRPGQNGRPARSRSTPRG